ncbi:MAG TPA: GvpL/GvpF family gas vesicle protein, partial [Longimicrobiales bacterium]|nr:GvpL/GvpF family gas vesicle protein [Longimicrobiales bacterium]
LGGDVAARREGLVRALDRVRGAMEVGVRILARDTPATPAPDRSSGRAYMESLVRRTRQFDADRQRGEAVAKELGDSLAGVIREQRVRALESGVGLAAVAYLVPRHDISECQRRVRTFAGTRPDLDFQISGPWPPYGFVDDGQ